MELHCPVICMTPDRRILIAKRTEDRKILPGCWEFGAAKPNGKEPLEVTLKREYKEDFNADIDIIKSADPKHSSPVPISSYEVEKDGELCKGIIFMGLIRNPAEITITDKHSEFMLATIPDLNNIMSAECVPGFKYNIKIALSLMAGNTTKSES